MPGEQVEVAVAVGVPDPAALAAHEHALRRAERVHQRAGVALRPELAETGGRLDDGQPGRRSATGSAHGVTIVPTPSLVKTSSSSACGTRPSSTCALRTPPWTARRHASIFGIMPLDSDGQQLGELGRGQRRR